jgi:hypothetical protein
MTRLGDRDGGSTYATDGAERDEEVLETGRPPSSRRTGVTWLAGALVLVAVAALLVAAHRRPARHPQAAPTTSPVVPVQPLPFPVPDQGAPPALMLGSTLYMVRDGRLIAHRADTIAEMSVTVGDAAETGGSYLLAADLRRSRVWVVKSLPARILIYEFVVPALREVHSWHIEGQMAGLDELNGELYLSATAGVVGISARRTGLLDWTPLRGGRAIVADGLRNRLLLLDQNGASVRIRAESPDLTQPGTSASLPFLTGSFLVVAGHIWAAGRGVRGAVLVRLDPRTLRPIRHSAAERPLGAGAVFVAAGARSFLVRERVGGRGLWCVDATTGKVLQAWPTVPGPVVIGTQPRPGRNPIYGVPSGSTPVALDAGNCPG